MREVYEYSVKDIDDESSLGHGEGLDNFRNKMNDLVHQMETGQLTGIHVSFAGVNEETKTLQVGNISAGVNQLGPWSQEESITVLSTPEENLIQAYHTLVGQFALEMIDDGTRWAVNPNAANYCRQAPQIHFKEE